MKEDRETGRGTKSVGRKRGEREIKILTIGGQTIREAQTANVTTL